MNKMNKEAEKFLIVTMAKRHPEIQRSTLFQWGGNFYLERENQNLFDSPQYLNEEERARAMFPGMPEEELKMISCKFYIHRSNHHGGDHEKRIKELKKEITDPELVAVLPQVWWAE